MAVTDAGLVHVSVAGLTNLKEIDLAKTGISYRGLAHFKGLSNLDLALPSTVRKFTCTPAWCNLKGLTKLSLIWLSGIPRSPIAGWPIWRDCPIFSARLHSTVRKSRTPAWCTSRG